MLHIRHNIVHMVSIASVYSDAMDAKLLRCTNTKDMRKLVHLRLVYHSVLHIANGSFGEKELTLIQEAERNASLCIPDIMGKLSSDNHVLNENLTILTNNLEKVLDRWGLSRPITRHVFRDVWGRCETDVHACSSGRGG